MSENEGVPSGLLGGIHRASRPTGPVLSVVVLLLCLLVGQTLGTLVFGWLLGVTPGELLDVELDLADQLVLTLSSLGAVGLLAAWIRWKERRPFLSVGFRLHRTGIHLTFGALVALAMLTLPVLVNLLFGQYALSDPMFRAIEIGGVLLALVGFVVQASTEEIMTRGYLMQTTYRRWGLPAAVILQALVFAALHGVNAGFSVVALVNLLLISTFFAFWALAEGSLWGVCAFHSVWNWCQGNVYGIEVSGLDVRTTWLDVDDVPGSASLITGGPFGVEGSLITTAVLAVATAVAVVAFRRRSSPA